MIFMLLLFYWEFLFVCMHTDMLALSWAGVTRRYLIDNGFRYAEWEVAYLSTLCSRQWGIVPLLYSSVVVVYSRLQMVWELRHQLML